MKPLEDSIYEEMDGPSPRDRIAELEAQVARLKDNLDRIARAVYPHAEGERFAYSVAAVVQKIEKSHMYKADRDRWKSLADELAEMLGNFNAPIHKNVLDGAEIYLTYLTGGTVTGYKVRIFRDVDKLLAKHAASKLEGQCAECGGSGYIQGKPTTYETDSAAEREYARLMARRKCECLK